MTAGAPALAQIRLVITPARARLRAARREVGRPAGQQIGPDGDGVQAQLAADRRFRPARRREPHHLVVQLLALAAVGGRRAGRSGIRCHLRRRVGRHRPGGSGGGLPERGALTLEETLERVADVLGQVEAVGHLRRARRALPPTLGVGPAAIAADDLDAGVLDQPRGEGRGAAVGQEVDWSATLEVHQDRAVRLAAPHRPIVHAEDARRRSGGQRGGVDGPQERVGACHQTEGGEQARTGFAAEGEGDRGEDGGEAGGAPRVGRDHRRHALGKGPPRAGRRPAIEAPELEVQADREPLPGEIGEPPTLAAVQVSGGHAAIGAAGRVAARDDDDGDRVRLGNEFFQVQRSGVGQERGGAHHGLLSVPPAPRGRGHRAV